MWFFFFLLLSASSAGLLKNMKNVMNQVLEALGSRPVLKDKDVLWAKPSVAGSPLKPSTETAPSSSVQTAGPEEASIKDALQSVLSLLAHLKEKKKITVPGEAENAWMIEMKAGDLTQTFSSSSSSSLSPALGETEPFTSPALPRGQRPGPQSPSRDPSSSPRTGGQTPSAASASGSGTDPLSSLGEEHVTLLEGFSAAPDSSGGFRYSSAASPASPVRLQDGPAAVGSFGGVGEADVPLASQGGDPQPLHPGASVAGVTAGEREGRNVPFESRGGLGTGNRMPEVRHWPLSSPSIRAVVLVHVLAVAKLRLCQRLHTTSGLPYRSSLSHSFVKRPVCELWFGTTPNCRGVPGAVRLRLLQTVNSCMYPSSKR